MELGVEIKYVNGTLPFPLFWNKIATLELVWVYEKLVSQQTISPQVMKYPLRDKKLIFAGP